MSMSRRRVVVTGLGLVSPVGNTVAEGWANLVAGRIGHRPITKFDASAFACRFAGEVQGLQRRGLHPGQGSAHMDTFIHYGMAASIQAVQDAGLPHGDALTESRPSASACLVGSGIGGLPMIEANHERIPRARRAPHLAVLRAGSIINMISGHMCRSSTASPAPTWPSPPAPPACTASARPGG
jgi:3-oxoacyl-[acyl-carrier-protein] synthase II